MTSQTPILVRVLAAAMALLLVGLVGLFFAKQSEIRFALLPPDRKFAQAWGEDVLLLEKSKLLPAQWSDIGSTEIRSEPSPARDWLEIHRPPISIKKNGHFKLQLFAIHWIEGNRYGVTLEYWLIDAKSGNTIWEAARRLKLGFVY